MNGALKNQTILSAILNVATHPVLRKFGQIQRLRITRAFTAAILRKTPSGFSVSFAPEPDETETLAYTKAPSKEAKTKKNSEKDTKSKEKPANKPKRVKKSAKEAEGVKALQGQKNITVLGIDGSPDHALPIAVSEQSTTSPQIQGRKHTPIQQPGDKATCETSVAGSRYHKPAGQQLDDEAFITDDLAAESFESEDHRNTALGGAEEHEKTVPPGDSHSAAAKKKERSEARNKRAADGIAGSRFALDQTPIKPVSPAELAQRATPSSAKKAKQDNRDPQSSSKELRSPSPVRKATQTDHKADFKSKTALLNKPLSTKKEPWQVQKQALKKKFGSEGWKPRKKLSPDTIEGIRALHEQFPDKYSTPILAEKFKVSPEAIRRILKSRWRPDPEKQAERRERWARRHDRIWDQQAAIGLRPARSKTKEPKEPGDSDDNVDIEEFHLARSRKQARDIHFADDTWT